MQASAVTTRASGGATPGTSPAQHARDDRLVGADRLEAVGAGQVDHHDAAALDVGLALAALDRHAGVVPDPGAQPGERVEERRLARVRRAEEPEPERRGRADRGAAPPARPTHGRSPARGSHAHALGLAPAQAELRAADLVERRVAERRAPERRAPRVPGTKPRSSRRAATGEPSSTDVDHGGDAEREPRERQEVPARPGGAANRNRFSIPTQTLRRARQWSAFNANAFASYSSSVRSWRESS